MPKKPKLNIWDQRILDLLKHCVAGGLTQREFLLSIGYAPENSPKLKNGTQSVRPQHLLKAAQAYNVNMNWLFGLDNAMNRTPGKDPLDRLKEAVTAVEREYRKRR